MTHMPPPHDTVSNGQNDGVSSLPPPAPPPPPAKSAPSTDDWDWERVRDLAERWYRPLLQREGWLALAYLFVGMFTGLVFFVVDRVVGWRPSPVVHRYRVPADRHVLPPRRRVRRRRAPAGGDRRRRDPGAADQADQGDRHAGRSRRRTLAPGRLPPRELVLGDAAVRGRFVRLLVRGAGDVRQRRSSASRCSPSIRSPASSPWRMAAFALGAAPATGDPGRSAQGPDRELVRRARSAGRRRASGDDARDPASGHPRRRRQRTPAHRTQPPRRGAATAGRDRARPGHGRAPSRRRPRSCPRADRERPPEGPGLDRRDAADRARAASGDPRGPRHRRRTVGRSSPTRRSRSPSRSIPTSSSRPTSPRPSTSWSTNRSPTS